MTIISYAFLLLFLPISLFIYWVFLRTPRLKLWGLSILSVLFYGLAGWKFIGLLLGLSLATFLLAKWRRTGWAILLNILALFLFKYWNFGADNLNALGADVGLNSFAPAWRLALPLGISFYTFKHLGYLIDVRQKRYAPTTDMVAFIAFSTLFWQISAGPISSFEDTGIQLQNLPRRLSSENIYQGLLHICLGLAKKLLIATPLYWALQSTLFVDEMNFGGLIGSWFNITLYALQLYFDFSGYTDIVLGGALLFGLKLPPNFNNPYLASNPSQFWQRWHMSASTWFRLYLFSPISRSLLRRWGTTRREIAQIVANMVTMLLIGLWHGAGWGFILWGGYHGLLLSVNGLASRRRWKLPHPAISTVLLVIAVFIGWAFFLAPNLNFAFDLLAHMFGLHGIGSVATLQDWYDKPVLLTTLVAILIVLSGRTEAANIPKLNPITAFLFGILGVLSLLQLGDSVEFIYVQF